MWPGCYRVMDGKAHSDSVRRPGLLQDGLSADKKLKLFWLKVVMARYFSENFFRFLFFLFLFFKKINFSF